MIWHPQSAQTASYRRDKSQSRATPLMPTECCMETIEEDLMIERIKSRTKVKEDQQGTFTSVHDGFDVALYPQHSRLSAVAGSIRRLKGML